jgi:hypothetical protein
MPPVSPNRRNTLVLVNRLSPPAPSTTRTSPVDSLPDQVALNAARRTNLRSSAAPQSSPPVVVQPRLQPIPNHSSMLTPFLNHMRLTPWHQSLGLPTRSFLPPATPQDLEVRAALVIPFTRSHTIWRVTTRRKLAAKGRGQAVALIWGRLLNVAQRLDGGSVGQAEALRDDRHTFHWIHNFTGPQFSSNTDNLALSQYRHRADFDWYACGMGPLLSHVH